MSPAEYREHARSRRVAFVSMDRALTVVPTRIYFKKGRLKVELALARGKRQHDKRAAARERDIERDVQAELKERR